jgi:hypothetical protein
MISCELLKRLAAADPTSLKPPMDAMQKIDAPTFARFHICFKPADGVNEQERNLEH